MSSIIVKAFTVKKTLLGGFQVEFNCPHCGAELRSKESEIEEQDWCPECRQPFQISPAAMSEIESQREDEQNAKVRNAEEKRERTKKRRREDDEKKRQKREELEKRKQRAQSEDIFETASKPSVESRKVETPQKKPRENVFLKSCPFCKSDIPEHAIKCRYCGEFVDGRTLKPDSKTQTVSKPQRPLSRPARRPAPQKSSGGIFSTISGVTLAVVSGGILLMGACCIGIFNKETSQPPVSVDANSDQKADKDKSTLKTLDQDVTMQIEIQEVPSNRVRILGKTNLPMGTHLMLSVKEKINGGFFGQSKCSVRSDGSFQSESFGPSEGLQNGIYVAEALMPLPGVQPKSVQNIIGAKGEKLTGPLVNTKDYYGVTVSTEKEFTIGGEQAEQEQISRANERVSQYREWQSKVEALHERLVTARSKNWLAEPNNTTNLEKWGSFAREFRSDFTELQNQLDDVQPTYARVLIASALGDVIVMFHDTAFQKPEAYTESSFEYTRSLKELRKFINESETK